MNILKYKKLSEIKFRVKFVFIPLVIYLLLLLSNLVFMPFSIWFTFVTLLFMAITIINSIILIQYDFRSFEQELEQREEES